MRAALGEGLYAMRSPSLTSALRVTSPRDAKVRSQFLPSSERNGVNARLSLGPKLAVTCWT
jgi:hypothetical protein